MPGPLYLPARINIAIYKPSYDGKYWGRYPNGDKPGPGMFVDVDVDTAAQGDLTTGIKLKGAPSIATSVTAALTTSGGGSGVKFHAISQGGFYAYFNNASYSGTINQATSFLARNDIANIAGIQIYFRVSEMEVTKGDYTQIFSSVDHLLSLCVPAGKRLAFGIWDRGFGTSDGSSGGIGVPTYMAGGSHGGPAGSNAYCCWAASGSSFGGVDGVLNYGSQTLINDLIALFSALGDRYNNHPNVEAFIFFGETSFNPQSTSPTGDQFNAAIQQIFNAIKPHWPNTILRLETNFVPGGTSGGNNAMNTWLSMLQGGQASAGGPDPVGGTGFTTTANLFFTNVPGHGATNGDLRGKALWWSECQLNGVGGSHSLFPGGSGSGAQLGSTTAVAMINAQAAQGAQYFSVNAADNTDTVQFNRDMLPAINAINGRLTNVVPPGNWNQA